MKTGFFHIPLIIGLHKKTAVIAVNGRCDDAEAFDISDILFYCNLPH